MGRRNNSPVELFVFPYDLPNSEGPDRRSKGSEDVISLLLELNLGRESSYGFFQILGWGWYVAGFLPLTLNGLIYNEVCVYGNSPSLQKFVIVWLWQLYK